MMGTRHQGGISGSVSQASIQVRESQASRPFSFSREIGGILTRRGCNDSACHGGVKGRGGFKLSLDARHPQEDHRWIVEGGTYRSFRRERRTDPAASGPEKSGESLLLQKPTFQIPMAEAAASLRNRPLCGDSRLGSGRRPGSGSGAAPDRENRDRPTYLVLEKGQHRQCWLPDTWATGRPRI